MKPYAPYIGITDFMNRKQSHEILEHFSELPGVYDSPHKLMVGVMMSHKTLHGLPTKWSAVFPKKDTIADIFVDDPLLFNTLHYADYTNADVVESIAQAVRFGGPSMHALQLDMVWPSPREIYEGIPPSKRDISVILQVGTRALEAINDDPLRLVRKLEVYTGIVDGVLLDKSMGQGKPMNSERLLSYVNAVARHLPRFRIGVAGGLGPETINLVEPIVARYPNVSIDAQGRLRPSGNALDPIHWPTAKRYLDVAVNLFSAYQRRLARA